MSPSKLATDVLGNFFKHKNLTSFIRQLNMYDFSKVSHISEGNLSSPGDEPLEFRNQSTPYVQKQCGPAHLADRLQARPP